MKELINTKGKLKEAMFFLENMERTYYDHAEDIEVLMSDDMSPPECQYYFSAFISAARSVMWVMRNECHKIEGWEQWYQSHAPNKETSELLKRINDVRVRSEKKSPLQMKSNITLSTVTAEQKSKPINNSLPKWRKKRYHLKVEPVNKEDGSEEGFEGTAELKSFNWNIDEFKKTDILEVCRSYMGELEKMVHECEAFLKKALVVENKKHNRISGGFSPPLSTTPLMRVRKGRFSKPIGPWPDSECSPTIP